MSRHWQGLVMVGLMVLAGGIYIDMVRTAELMAGIR